MATAKKSVAAKKAAVTKPEPKSALGKVMAQNQAIINSRQAKAGYALSLVKAIAEDNRRLGALEVGKPTRINVSQHATAVNNLTRANELLLRWMRDYVEGK